MALALSNCVKLEIFYKAYDQFGSIVEVFMKMFLIVKRVKKSNQSDVLSI